jgi:hypothetical protein
MKLLEALRNATDRMAPDFNDSKLFTHSGDKGEFRERIIEKFLRPFLPKCYGLGSGEVFSQDGASSRQIDVVVYDDVFSNVLFREGSNSLFPCESVFGTIEVKSVLSAEELATSIENVASVKRLPRRGTTMLNVTPISEIHVGGGLQYTQPLISNPYIGVIFAYSGLRPENVLHELNEYLFGGEPRRDYLPDFVFLYGHETTIMRFAGNGNRLKAVSPEQPFDGYMAITTGRDTMPYFFLTLNTLLNSIRLKAPDFAEYRIKISW